MGAHEVPGRRGHHILVQMLGIKPGPVHKKGVADAGVVDPVGILLPVTGGDGVEFGGDLHRPGDHDVIGQAGVHRQREPVQGDAGGGFEIGHIDPGVDPGVGPPGPGAFHRMAHHQLQAFFQGLLHADGVFLDLPAVVGGAHIHQL